MEALKDLKAWESFYFTVTGNHIYDDFPDFKDVLEDREKSMITFMRKRPGKISWVNLAEAAYCCGEEEILDQLSEKMKSPEGTYEIHAHHHLEYGLLKAYPILQLYKLHFLSRSNINLSCSESIVG